MLIELYIFSFAIIAYGIIITLAIIGFNKLRQKKQVSNSSQHQFISIVVAARNEEACIREFIYELSKQTFLKSNFELIFVDDASEDNTYNIAKEFIEKSGISFQLIKNTNHLGKKKSLALAIDNAKGDIIITTDADVIYRHSNWLQSIANYFNNYSPNLLIMPVDYKNQSGFLSLFQITENAALTGITAGFAGINKPFMCNGANLAFKKEAFYKVNGYRNHLHLSSGEDVFLLEDLKKIDTRAIHYHLSREAIVKTQPEISLNSFISQRIRWASKTKQNSNALNSFIGFIVVLSNLIFLALLVAILKKSVIMPYLSIFALAKCVFDFLLLFLASDFLGRLKYVWWLIPFESIYWIYTLYIGIASVFYKPSWKGKKIN